MSPAGDGDRPRRSRWSSFAADPDVNPSRILREIGNPDHRLRVEHDQQTLLIHLSDEDGHGWTVFAVDRRSREWAVAQGQPNRQQPSRHTTSSTARTDR
jgi:hypothetical protein